jgi:DNA-binding response OmpR family regulator
VTKPFSMRELTARIRAVLRRASRQSLEPDLVRAADLTLDRTGRTVTFGKKRIHLTPSEFSLLSALMSAPGRVFSRTELLDRMQDIASESYERSVDVHIRNLRLKIEPDPRHPRYVETVYGAGYRFASGENK